MNKFLFAAVAVSLLNTLDSVAQDIPQSQLPSLILNNFQKTFPKASDVEWEMDGSFYKAGFETGLYGADHQVWFDKSGKLAKHKEEISKSDLPGAVRTKLDKVWSNYRVDDVDKITEAGKVTYMIELKTFSEEWTVIFDAAGNVLGKVAD
jgi:hypothetical protein